MSDLLRFFLDRLTPVVAAAAACLLLAGSAMAAQPPAAARVFKETGLPPEALARVGAARLRHADRVRSVAYSPDGRWLVSAGADGNVNVWDAASGALQRRITTIGGRPASANEILATFARDGKEIVVIGPKKDAFHLHLRCFDLDTGQEQMTFAIGRAGNKDQIDERRGLVLAADGSVFGVKVGEREYRLWDATGGKVLRSFTLPSAWNQRPVLAPAGNLIAFLEGRATEIDEFNKGARAKIFDVRTGKELLEIREPRRQLATAAFTSDGKTLATITYQLGSRYELALWEVPTGRLLRRIPKIESSASCACFSDDGQRLAIGTDHGRFVQVFATGTGAALGRFPSPPHLVRLAFTPDGQQLAAASDEGVVVVWDIAKGTPAVASADPASEVFSLRFTDDRQLLLLGGGASVRDGRSGKVVRRLAEALPVSEHTFALSPDLRLAAVSEGDGTIRLVEAATGKPVRELSGLKGYTQALHFAADSGRLFARSYVDPQFHIWVVATGAPLRQLPLGPERHGWDEVAVAPDGQRLATLTWDEKKVPVVRLWDTANGRLLHRLRPKGLAMRLAFSPDGALLACCGGDDESPFNAPGRVTLWDTASGQERSTFSGHTTAIYCLQFAPDGRTLATGAYDGMVRLWEIAARQERHVFQGHTGFVFSVAYAPSGRWLASSSREAPVYVWDVYGAPARADFSAAEGRQLWEDLAVPEAAKAFQAVRQLIAVPDAAVALLAANLKPRPIPAAGRVRQLVDELGSASFEVRQQAFAELRLVADALAPALQRALDETKILERRQRLTQLVAIAAAPLPQRLRELRALEVLEQVATPAAARLLEEWARGPVSARLTLDASAAQKRLQR